MLSDEVDGFDGCGLDCEAVLWNVALWHFDLGELSLRQVLLVLFLFVTYGRHYLIGYEHGIMLIMDEVQSVSVE
jgi:hypothetical protein